MTPSAPSLATRGADFGDGSVYITYRNVSAPCRTRLLPQALNAMRIQQVILSVIGVPGALLAGWMVELPYIGRKGTLALSTSTPPPPSSSAILHAPLPTPPPTQSSQACSSSRARPHGRRTRFSATTARTPSRATSCTACSTRSRPSCSRPRAAGRATRSSRPRTASSASWCVVPLQGDCAKYLRGTIGADRCALREPLHAGADLRLRCALPSLRANCAAAPVRAEGEGVALEAGKQN